MPADLHPIEFHAAREHLGLTWNDLARLLHVNERTIRNWETGRATIPAGVKVELEQLLTYTDTTETSLLEQLDNADGPRTITAYTTDEQFHATYPASAFTARWWRQLAHRVARKRPGTRIGAVIEL